MSTSNFGFGEAVYAGPLPSNYWNDLVGTVDNQLDNLVDSIIVNGVISGWGINTSGNLEVSAGEGWVGGAHCVTSSTQEVTGVTASVLNYVFAVRKVPATGRVSSSFAAGEVSFEANTTGVAPANSILIATGVANGGATGFTTVDNTPATTTASRITFLSHSAAEARRFFENFGEFIYNGIMPEVPVSGLSITFPAGVVYVKGYRIEKLNDFIATVTASKDTYVDVSTAGTFTLVAVNNGASAPAVTANSLRICKIVSNGTDITGVTDLTTNTYTTNVTPDTEDTIAHSLGRIPRGFILIRGNKAGIIYDSGTTWTDEYIYLKCNVASMQATLLIF